MRKNVRIWGPDEARAWTLLVPGSQTERETEFLVWAFARLSARKVSNVLDLGCGTGRLAVELALRGYSVTGVDRSAAMLEGARQAAAERGVHLGLCKTSLEALDVEGSFDAAYGACSTFNYLLDEDGLSLSLGKLRELIRPGGVLVLDMANYAAIYGSFKRAIVQEVKGDGWSVRKRTEYEIDDVRMLSHHHETNVLKTGGETRRWKETHTLRMWAFPELKGRLTANGFGGLRLFGEMKAGARAASRHAQRLVIVCRAI